MNTFEESLTKTQKAPLVSQEIETLQVNVGLRCNMACKHCHVGASPDRGELMTWDTMQAVEEMAERLHCRRVDITGGAPELHPRFRDFISLLRRTDKAVNVRTNLTVLLEPAQASLPEFFRDQQVSLVASLPCYLDRNVDAQRGAGAYEKSIEAIRRLNAVGYGVEEHLTLSLVFNPNGLGLPPAQKALEADYRRELKQRFDVRFTNLLTITNSPIGRFREELQEQGLEKTYMALLIDNFNPDTVDGLMCRHQLSVGWDGRLYDCDFNLALGWSVNHGVPDTVATYEPLALMHRRIVTGKHCFACTAGSGSSCGGALT